MTRFHEAEFPAWASDDLGDDEAAQHYRAEALDLFQSCLDAGESLGENRESEQLMFLDMHRRIGNFEKAGEIAASLLAASSEDLVLAVAEFQQILVKREDRAQYYVGDAEGYARRPRRWERRWERVGKRPWWKWWA